MTREREVRLADSVFGGGTPALALARDSVLRIWIYHENEVIPLGDGTDYLEIDLGAIENDEITVRGIPAGYEYVGAIAIGSDGPIAPGAPPMGIIPPICPV